MFTPVRAFSFKFKLKEGQLQITANDIQQTVKTNLQNIFIFRHILLCKANFFTNLKSRQIRQSQRAEVGTNFFLSLNALFEKANNTLRYLDIYRSFDRYLFFRLPL